MRKSTRSRRHHYTTLTNASTSLRRQGEHNRTQSLPGLLTLTPSHATGWPWQTSHEPYWLPCEIASEHSAAGQLWPARDALARFPDRAWRDLAHANCTPFFSPKHLDFVTEKNSFFCHLENTVFQTLPKNAFFIRFAHILLFLGGSNNHSLVQNQRVYRSFSPKKNFVG